MIDQEKLEQLSAASARAELALRLTDKRIATAAASRIDDIANLSRAKAALQTFLREAAAAA